MIIKFIIYGMFGVLQILLIDLDTADALSRNLKTSKLKIVSLAPTKVPPQWLLKQDSQSLKFKLNLCLKNLKGGCH